MKGNDVFNHRLNYTFYSYMGEVEEHGQKFPKYKKIEQKAVKLNIE